MISPSALSLSKSVLSLFWRNGSPAVANVRRAAFLPRCCRGTSRRECSRARGCVLPHYAKMPATRGAHFVLMRTFSSESVACNNIVSLAGRARAASEVPLFHPRAREVLVQLLPRTAAMVCHWRCFKARQYTFLQKYQPRHVL